MHVRPFGPAFGKAIILGVFLVLGTAARGEVALTGLDLALKIEEALTGVAERASNAVVVITNKQRVQARRQQQDIPPEFRWFFGLPEQPPFGGGEGRPGPQVPDGGRPREAGMGSGVIVQADGYLVTNYHVIQGHDELVVKLLDGRVFDSARGEGQVEVVGIDQDTDLAVLRIGGGTLADLPTVAFGDSDRIRVGQYAIAVGAPFSLDYSVTIGHISQKGRHGMRMTNFENYIQTDASINPGNSGGPLLNIHGEMIGINQFIMTGGGASRGNIGLGFAIPSNLVKRVVSDLIENGAVARPFLGIGMQELTDLLKRRYGVQGGVLIESVVEGGAAEQAGIKAGDVVTRVGEKAVDSPHDLLFAVLAYKPGDLVKVTVSRDGEVKTFEVVARVRDSAGAARPRNGDSGPAENMGLRLQVTEQGLVVAAIQPDSPATRAEPEIRVGDLVVMVNGEKVENLRDVAEALKKTKNQVVLLYVDRGRRGKYLIGVPLN